MCENMNTLVEETWQTVKETL